MNTQTDRPDNSMVVQMVLAFNEALNQRDVDSMMRLMTDDCVFENTSPPPDGTRYAGQEAVRQFWQEFFQGSAQATIEPEEIFASGERCVMRWVYHWVEPGGESGHIRGIDLYTLRDGLIAEKLSYVKG
jgi:ketosteroid isomerase-like protein